MDNRFTIANLIACSPDTPRVVGDADVFGIQDRVIEGILGQVQQQVAIEEAPKVLDPAQQAVATVLRKYVNIPGVDRQEVKSLLQGLKTPLRHVHVKALKEAYMRLSSGGDLPAFMADLRALPLGEAIEPSERTQGRALTREDLHLVCFDYVWS